MADLVFRAPARMEAIANCRRWNLSDVPAGSGVVVDLGSWQRVFPTSVIGVICTLARLIQDGCSITVTAPRHEYARRLLETIGFLDALQTFGVWKRAENYEVPPPIRRVLPIIPVQNFRTASDVDAMAEKLDEAFQSSGRLAGSMLQTVTTALTEAAANVVQHADSPVGGFALAQARQLRRRGATINFVQIVVGDSGVGIASSLQRENDVEAIVYALQEGSTRLHENHRGYGLFEIASAAEAAPDRLVTIHSGRGYVNRAFGNEPVARSATRPFNGTLVTVALPVG